MSKEAEILKTSISYHGTLLPKIKQIKRGHVSQVCRSYKNWLLSSLTMDKVTSSIELKISQRIENAFWQSLKAEVNRSIRWKLTILHFLKKWTKICLTSCILKTFLCFWRFLSRSNKTGNFGQLWEMQSSSSGSIKHTRSIFFQSVGQNVWFPLLWQLLFLDPPF